MNRIIFAGVSLSCAGFYGKKYFEGGVNHHTPDMTGKTVVITGGNSGIY